MKHTVRQGHDATTRPDGGGLRRALRAVAVVMAVGLAPAGMAGAAGAAPRIPEEDPPLVEEEPFVAPPHGFTWRLPARFGSYRNGIVDYHWNEAEGSRFAGPAYTYDPAHVRPTSLTATFDGCPKAEEAAASPGSTAYTYRWERFSTATPRVAIGDPVVQRDCRWERAFDIDPVTGVGEPTVVRLTITDPSTGAPFSGYETGKTFDEQTVQVRDLLIVSIGDSYASGEGSPDIPQVINELGRKIADARWVDRRCHRSAAAPSAQAALALEASDPHSSITFLSFACSGANISKEYFGNTSDFDPYRDQSGTAQNSKGTGILDPYIGTEPVHNDDIFKSIDYSDKLPSQIAQLRRALTNDSSVSPRQVAALTVSAGGNDMGFGPVASVCTIYWNCPEHGVESIDYSGDVTLRERFHQSVGEMAARYAALGKALRNFTIAKTYITQYPDPTKGENGVPCPKMLHDVIPGWMSPLLGPAAILDWSAVPLPDYQMDEAEVRFAGGEVLEAMNGAVMAGAAAQGWTAIGGIADADGNIFSGHGYCAPDSWIRNASDATYLQGPWDDPVNCNAFNLMLNWPRFLLGGCVPPATTETTGTLHPTPAGYSAIGKRIVEDMKRDGIVPPPPSMPPVFSDTRSVAQHGANGWLTGKATGQTCGGGVTSCVVVKLTVTADKRSPLRGVSLSRNGVPVACSATGATANGITCRSGLASDGTYSWTVTFREDGIYQLELVATSRNDTVATSRREFKVDLRDPIEASANPTAANPPTGAWYRDPVDVTFGGTDAAGGSGIQGVEYTLDGSGPMRLANGDKLTISGDGVHTVTYRPVDVAGRMGPAQAPLTVKVDRTSPTVNCASADGAWHGADVSVACTATDGGSGLAAAADASFGLTTAVPADTETANAPTVSRSVCDMAGNCSTAGPVGINLVDKKAPAITVTSPSANANYYLDQAVAVAFSCADGGSGVLEGSCVGSLANGALLDTSTVGSGQMTADAQDKAGNSGHAAVAYTVTKRTTALTYTGDESADYHDPARVSATLMDTSPTPDVAVAGAEVVFSLGATTCRATTDSVGRASCSLTADQPAGPSTVSVVYDGNERLQRSSLAAPFTVNLEQATLTYQGATLIANRGEARLAGTLKEEGTTPIPGRSVTFTLGQGPGAQTCIGSTDSAGIAQCTVTGVAQPLGPGTVSVSFASDGFYTPATASAATLTFEYLPQGTFVAGEGTAGQGQTLNFWGAQWAKANGGASSFKGYAATSANPPPCGGTFTSGPETTQPPASVPAYMAVAITDEAPKAGERVTGQISGIVVVRTDGGYGPDAGKPGYGTVVAVVC